jgi:uncharacterized protein (DUF1800 family)
MTRTIFAGLVPAKTTSSTQGIDMSNSETMQPPVRPRADEETDAHAPVTHTPSGATAALSAVAAAAALSACGGGDDASTIPSPTGGATPQAGNLSQAAAYSAKVAPTLRDAHRFLVQATFGPKPGEPEALMKAGALEAWLDAQFGTAPVFTTYNLTKLNYEDKAKIGGLYPDAATPNGSLHRDHVGSAWWQMALTAPDQLRQRVAFALSEILVIAMTGGTLAEWPYLCASYYDLLLNNAFGNYKDLVTQVAGHPAMGMFLSHLSNSRPSGARIPDQNFARELMQLFTLGLVNLKADGTVITDTAGKPVETYKPYDVEVLSHVFTGWGWRHTFSAWFDRYSNIASQTSPMSPYVSEHSALGEFPRIGTDGKIQRFTGTALTGEIKLLGQVFTPTGDPVADRAAAIDIIFQHPNVAPFVAKAMIQRLVTSNPSALYIGRVAAAFKSSSWNMQSLIRAILFDQDARDTAKLCDVQTSPTYGKLKEPILRVTQFMRAMKVRSINDAWACGALDTVSAGWPRNALGQAPLLSPTVFNFFRPGYVSPGGEMAKQTLVTPEMQICSETEVAVYVRFMMAATRSGFGFDRDNDIVNNPICNIITRYWPSIYPDYSEELAVLIKAGDSATTRINNFIALVNRKLFGNAMSTSLQNHLKTVANSMQVGTWAGSVKDFEGRPSRGLNALITACVISPEFVVQR